MSQYEKIKYFLIVWWYDVKLLPSKIKRRIWNKHILLWWYKLWIRKDEFHHSLDMDGVAMLEMNEQERKKYFVNLVRRREKAHQRNLVNI